MLARSNSINIRFKIPNLKNKSDSVFVRSDERSTKNRRNKTENFSNCPEKYGHDGIVVYFSWFMYFVGGLYRWRVYEFNVLVHNVHWNYKLGFLSVILKIDCIFNAIELAVSESNLSKCFIFILFFLEKYIVIFNAFF